MFHKSIEYQTYAFTEDGPTSLSINRPKFTMCQHRTSQGGVSPLYSCKMVAGRRRLLNLQEAVESIFADNDSDNENFDCGSDFEAEPDSEEDLQTEDSDLDDSLVASQDNTLRELSSPQERSEGTFFHQYIVNKNSFL